MVTTGQEMVRAKTLMSSAKVREFHVGDGKVASLKEVGNKVKCSVNVNEICRCNSCILFCTCYIFLMSLWFFHVMQAQVA